MKELSIEEKVKRYDEALRKARQLCAYPTSKPFISDLQDLFPELNEPGDEKMWKLLKKYAHYNISDLALEADHITREHLVSWLEKQVQSKKTSIWKHWKNGIAGSGDGVPAFLIKNGLTYSLSPCLSFECDYIELSELDSLMLGKQE